MITPWLLSLQALGAQKDVLVPMVTLPGNPVGESTIQASVLEATVPNEPLIACCV